MPNLTFPNKGICTQPHGVINRREPATWIPLLQPHTRISHMTAISATCSSYNKDKLGKMRLLITFQFHFMKFLHKIFAMGLW